MEVYRVAPIRIRRGSTVRLVRVSGHERTAQTCGKHYAAPKTLRPLSHRLGSRLTDTSSSSRIRWAGPSRSSYCPLRTDHQKTRPTSATITTDSGISKKRMSMCSVSVRGCHAIRHRSVLPCRDCTGFSRALRSACERGEIA